MNDYRRVKTVKAPELDSYLADGWEVIDITKTQLGSDDTSLTYHIGLTSRTLVQKLRGIIQDYERFGLKEELFKKVAESKGRNIDDYADNGGWWGVDEVSEYLNEYESLVHDRKTEYGKVEGA